MRTRPTLPVRASSTTLLGVAVALLAMFGGCSLDPVQNGAIAALPDEDPLYPQGPYHRAGQPCGLCHSSTGPASARPFAIAGTVFIDPFGLRPAKGVQVRVRDGTGNTQCKVTNCRGNFFFEDADYSGSGNFNGKQGPAFPVFVSVQRPLPGDPLGKFRPMQSRVGREASCATCHRPAPPDATGKAQIADFDTPGVVRLYESENEANAGIPVDPNEVCPPPEEENTKCPETP